MLLIVIEFHYEDKYLNYQDEIVPKVSFHELTMILEMNEQLNNHLQLKNKRSSNPSERRDLQSHFFLVPVPVKRKILVPVPVKRKILVPVPVKRKILVPVPVKRKVLVPVPVKRKILVPVQVKRKILVPVPVKRKVLVPVPVKRKILVPVPVPPGSGPGPLCRSLSES